jgi:nucleoside-triphosphatase THEP1
MDFKKANRTTTRARIAIQGCSGTGKTVSALKLAYLMCGNYEKIGIIDTTGQSHLYSNLGNYNVLSLEPPFSPERMIESISKAEEMGYDIIIVDTISDLYDGEGGILEIQNNISGNSYASWTKSKTLNNEFLKKILKSDKHVIVCVKAKSEYIISENNNKNKVERISLKGIQFEGYEKDFHLLIELDSYHNAVITCDKTQLFQNQIPISIDNTVANKIIKWLKEAEPMNEEEILNMIRSCKSLEDLNNLYKHKPNVRSFASEFNHRAAVIKGQIPEYKILQEQQNGQQHQHQ